MKANPEIKATDCGATKATRAIKAAISLSLNSRQKATGHPGGLFLVPISRGIQSTSRVAGVERDGDALSRSLEPLHAMLQPRWEKEKMAGGRRERDAHAGAHPGQFDPRSFVHRHSRAARITEDNLAAFDICWDLYVISGRNEASWMAVEDEIGRASCRESVESKVVEGFVEE